MSIAPTTFTPLKSFFYLSALEQPFIPVEKCCLTREIISGWNLSSYDEYGIAYFEIFDKMGKIIFWLNVGNFFEENTKAMKKFIMEFDPSYVFASENVNEKVNDEQKAFCAYQPPVPNFQYPSVPHLQYLLTPEEMQILRRNITGR